MIESMTEAEKYLFEQEVKLEAYYSWVNRGRPLWESNYDWEYALITVSQRWYQRKEISTIIDFDIFG